jgi:hypothetical protein
MEPVIVFIAFFASVFGIAYFYLITRNKERLALIQSGADASLFKAPSRNNSNWAYAIVLVLGFMAMGIGLGTFVAHLVEQQMYIQQFALKRSGDIEHVRHNFPHLYVMAIFFFGGLGLTSSFFVIRALNKKDEKSLVEAR